MTTRAQIKDKEWDVHNYDHSLDLLLKSAKRD